MAKKVLLISDTHGHLPPQIHKYAQECDEIWHAGDIGKLEVLEQLEKMKPLKGVYGNIDGMDIKNILPENLLFNCENVKIFMTHIGGSPDRIPIRVKKHLMENKPDIYICGHSHIVRVKSMPQFQNCIYINPGAAGNEGFHETKTFMLLELNDGKVVSLKVVELGKRGSN